MKKRIFRLLAFASLAFAGYHLLFFIERTVGLMWSENHFKSLQIIQPVIERYIALWLWDPVVLTFLLSPVWLVSGIFGLIFLYLGIKKEETNV